MIDAKLRQEIAAQIGLNEQYIYQCLTGRRNMKPIQATAIEKITNGAISRKMVCRTSWQSIWPELVEAKA
jgi:DNA-binding transcriptional regulator YdaS (Cro superfamily)